MSTDMARERGRFDVPVLLPAPGDDGLRDLRREFPECEIRRDGAVYTSLRLAGTTEEFHVSRTAAGLAEKLRGSP